MTVQTAQDPTELLARIVEGRFASPFAVLGPHPINGARHVVAFAPDAARLSAVVAQGQAHRLTPLPALPGLFAGPVPVPGAYRLLAEAKDGATWEYDDPYRYPPVLPDDTEVPHLRPWRVLGAHLITHAGTEGTHFVAQVPGAQRVSVVGEFNEGDGRRHVMRRLPGSDLWEIFLPDVGPGSAYGFEARLPDGTLRDLSDPYARAVEARPGGQALVAAPRKRPAAPPRAIVAGTRVGAARVLGFDHIARPVSDPERPLAAPDSGPGLVPILPPGPKRPSATLYWLEAGGAAAFWFSGQLAPSDRAALRAIAEAGAPVLCDAGPDADWALRVQRYVAQPPAARAAERGDLPAPPGPVAGLAAPDLARRIAEIGRAETLRCLLAWTWGQRGVPLIAQVTADVAPELVTDLNRLAHDLPELAAGAPMAWLDTDPAMPAVFGWLRGDEVAVICNFGPDEAANMRLGLPHAGVWHEVLNTDAGNYGGVGRGNFGRVNAQPQPWQGQPAAADLYLPPLGALILRYQGG